MALTAGDIILQRSLDVTEEENEDITPTKRAASCRVGLFCWFAVRLSNFPRSLRVAITATI